MKLLSNYKDFWGGSELLGTNKATQHTIDQSEETRLIHQEHYRVGQSSRKLLREHIDKHLEAGVIKPAQSKSASLISLVSRKNGALQFGANYWRHDTAIILDIIRSYLWMIVLKYYKKFKCLQH